ncbi:MAG: VanZ family protein [Eubacteriales bacterium]|nr:VanZ family protein [Eubacteriales bacterium]
MRYIVLFFWFLFMTYLSHQDGIHTAVFSRRLAELLTKLSELLTKHSVSSSDTEEVNKINGKIRRFAYVFVFFVLTVLCGMVFDFWYWIIFVILWAWADETTKPWIEGRHFSWYDVGLNLIGVGFGFLLTLVWKI